MRNLTKRLSFQCYYVPCVLYTGIGAAKTRRRTDDGDSGFFLKELVCQSFLSRTFRGSYKKTVRREENDLFCRWKDRKTDELRTKNQFDISPILMTEWWIRQRDRFPQMNEHCKSAMNWKWMDDLVPEKNRLNVQPLKGALLDNSKLSYPRFPWHKAD